MAADKSLCVRGVLAGVAPYASLAPALLEELADACRVVGLAPREQLLHDGQRATSAYVLVGGCLTRSLLTADGKTVILNYTRPVTSFGCASVIDGSAHVGVVEAREPSCVVAVPMEQITAALEASPAFALAMAHSLARSSVRQTEAIRELMYPVPVRLARLLCAHVDASGAVQLEMGKATVAEMLATVPETFSRALATLRTKGLVETNGRDLRVPDLQALRRYAQL